VWKKSRSLSEVRALFVGGADVHDQHDPDRASSRNVTAQSPMILICRSRSDASLSVKSPRVSGCSRRLRMKSMILARWLPLFGTDPREPLI
jgi:hypothetical protein